MARAASIFALRDIAPRSRQRLIGGPKVGCAISQLCNLGELLAKQKAANSKNGVVGKSGNGMPMIPRTKATAPPMRQSTRMPRLVDILVSSFILGTRQRVRLVEYAFIV